MSGILSRKERILDVILTEEGYRQMQSGDIRFSYATFTDKDSIYDGDENKIFKSGSHNFRLEASSNFYDTVNPELDLNRGGEYNITIDNISILENLNNLNDREQNFLTASTKISSNISDILKTHSILLTTSSLDQNFLNLVGNFNPDEFFNYYIGNNTSETLVQESVNLSNLDLIKDDARFSDKLNFLFLPPVNKNNTQLGFYESRQESKDKILVKKGISNFNDNFYLNSIEKIKNNLNIPRSEFLINQLKNDNSLILQVYENNVSNKTINKLAIIDHGEVLIKNSNETSTFKKIFSVGKIFQVEKNKSDPTLKESDKQIRIRSFYSFTNMFTIVFEEEQ